MIDRDGAVQAGLERNPDSWGYAEADHTDAFEVRCPDCETDVRATKGAHPGPSGLRVFGWRCDFCSLILPAMCGGAEASDYGPGIIGKVRELRRTQRYIPVTASSVGDFDGTGGER
jgi:hypothetical protein